MTSAAEPPPQAAAESLASVFDRRLIQVSVVVVLGIIMSILDTTIVNVALDTLARDFNSDLTTIQWVATGYLLALATVIPLTGWAMHRFGTKRLFIVSIVLFTLGSMLCGTAWSAESLIFFRVLQGFGGGMIMPVGTTLLTQEAGPQRVGRMMGVIGVPMLLAPIAGPILGGWLVDSVSWRWIFYVNVPIGIVTVALARRFLDTDRPSSSEPLDWKGLLLLSPGLAALVYGLAETGPNGGFDAPEVLVPMIAGIALVVAFVVHALRTSDALIDVHLFKDKVLAVATAGSFVLAMAFFSAMVLMPLYYQIVRGASAFEAGLMVAPQGVGAALMMPFAGRITDRHGAGRIVPIGSVLLLACVYGLTHLSATMPYWRLIGLLFLMGLGMGATMMPTMSSAYITLKHDEVPKATSGLNAIQRVGGSIGVAILTTYLTHAMVENLADVGIETSSRAGLGALEALPPGAHEKIAPLIADAFGSTFWVSFALLCLMFVISLFLPRHGTQAIIARRNDQTALPGEPPEAVPL
jgi:EmrB/QacA subfamily drug resistance transporter